MGETDQMASCVSLVGFFLGLCAAAVPARADDVDGSQIPAKLVGTFVGEIKASVMTRDKRPCRVSSEARITLNIAEHGVAKWRGYHRFEIACPGQNAPPNSCWTEGVATVTATPKDHLEVTTISTSKVAGPVPADRHIWKCGSVEMSVPIGVELDKRSCVRLGLGVDRRAEIGAQLSCDAGRDFPQLEKGSLTFDKRGQLTFPWDVGKNPMVLKRVSPTPVDAPPKKLYDDFGCRFDATRRRDVKGDEDEFAAIPSDLKKPRGTVEEYCEAITSRGVRREGPDVVTLPDGNVSERYLYKDGRLASGVAWYPSGNVRMLVESKNGIVVKTFFAKDGTRSSVEVDGRTTPLDIAPQPGQNVDALKRGPDLRGRPLKLEREQLSEKLESIQPAVAQCVSRARFYGTANIDVVVDASGKVSAEIESSPDNKIAECILAAVKTLSFQPTQTGAKFRYPVEMSPRNK